MRNEMAGRWGILSLVGVLALASPAFAAPGGRPGKHGIGKGGVPALENRVTELEAEVDALQAQVDELNEIVEGLAGAIDDDGDGVSEQNGDCDDADPAVNPGAIEVPGNGIDENCDGLDA
jgi:hypothetical protein